MPGIFLICCFPRQTPLATSCSPSSSFPAHPHVCSHQSALALAMLRHWHSLGSPEIIHTWLPVKKMFFWRRPPHLPLHLPQSPPTFTLHQSVRLVSPNFFLAALPAHSLLCDLPSAAIIKQELGFFDKTRTGELVGVAQPVPACSTPLLLNSFLHLLQVNRLSEDIRAMKVRLWLKKMHYNYFPFRLNF